MSDFTESASSESDAPNGVVASGPEQKHGKSKPTKNLPTDRVGKDTQFSILRAYAKASEDQGRTGVSNGDVAKYANVSPSSISVCNPFWNDAGLLVREGIKQRPVEAVYAYDQAAEWGADRPMSKLASVLASSWFGRPILARLALKPASVTEALSLLAEECKASLEYKSQVQLLLDYLEAAGLIVIEGTVVSKAAKAQNETPLQADTQSDSTTAAQSSKPDVPPTGSKRFAIPIPDKQDAVVTLPDDMDEEDWKMVSSFLTTYVKRWKKFS